MQREIVQPEFAGRFGRYRDFFDGAGAIVAAGPVDGDLRRIGLAGFDEEIAGKAHGLALVEGGDVVCAVLFHVDRAFVEIAFSGAPGGRELNLLVSASLSSTRMPSRSGRSIVDFEVGVGAFDGAKIAAVLVDDILQASPVRIAVGDANLLHAGKIDDADIEVARVERARFHVILDVFRQPREEKLEARAAGLRLHLHLFPFRGALVARVEADLVGLDADGQGGDELVGVAANRSIAGSDAKVVQRRSTRALARSKAGAAP